MASPRAPGSKSDKKRARAHPSDAEIYSFPDPFPPEPKKRTMLIRLRVRRPPEFPRFMDLPLELRRKIYEYAMESDFFGVNDRTKIVPHSAVRYGLRRPGFFYPFRAEVPDFFPPICNASPQIRIEAVPVFLSNSILRLDMGDQVLVFKEFLETFPDNTAFKAVRHLEYHWSTTYDNNIKLGVWGGTVPMFKLCPALHTIAFEYIYGPGFLKVDPTREAHTKTGPHRLKSDVEVQTELLRYKRRNSLQLKTMEELVEDHGLQALCECPSLKTVILRCIIATHKPKEGGILERTMLELEEWLRKRFESCGQDVIVELKWIR